MSWLSMISHKLRWMLKGLLRMGVTEQIRLSVEAMRHREALLADAKYDDPLRLTRSEHKVYSQHGEDGILAEIFRRIGTTNRRFVEVGVAPLENNTLYLLEQGWKGLWIDGALPIKEEYPDWLSDFVREGALQMLATIVTRENLLQILRDAEMPRELDLLSLDVDMNTYALWEGLADFAPRVVVVEYNAYLPPEVDWRVEYRADAVWDGSIYFGASLKAFERLGAERNYRLVGCDLSGGNAFFVKNDLAEGRFPKSGDAAWHYEPARRHLYLEPPEWKSGAGRSVVEGQ